MPTHSDTSTAKPTASRAPSSNGKTPLRLRLATLALAVALTAKVALAHEEHPPAPKPRGQPTTQNARDANPATDPSIDDTATDDTVADTTPFELTVFDNRARFDPTASSLTLAPHDLAAAPLRTADDALRLVPGIAIVQHGSEGKARQFFLRGFDG